MDHQVGERIQGRWQVSRVLQGGLGRVYIALDLENEELTAIKTFLGAVDPKTVDRFRQEAHAWLNLEPHPHVVRAGRFEVWNGRPYLFLEYVGGGDLEGWIGTPGLQRRPQKILEWAMQFCDGMVHARRQGLQAHRDVKPANCMITLDGRLKITDFGLAKVAGEVGLMPQAQARQWVTEVLSGQRSPNSAHLPDKGLTGTGAAMGTCTHMSPEQFSDAAGVDVRADVYSFGVMLFQMVSGRLPFEGNNFFQIAVQHVRNPPPTLSGGPPGLAELVADCLAKQPEQRPSDFDAVRTRLDEIYEHSFRSAPPARARAVVMDGVDKSNQAASLIKLGLVEEGARKAEEALRGEPSLWPALVNMGYALQRLGRCDEAMVYFEKALMIREEALLWSHVGVTLALLGHSKAEAALRTAVQMDAFYVHGHHNLALHLAGCGRLQEAREVFGELLLLAPRTATYWLGQGMVCFNLQDYAGARAAFSQSVELDPSLAHGWCYWGEVELATTGWEKALPCFERAVKENPALAKGWLHLGRGLVARQQYAEALPFLEKSLALDSEQALAHYVMGSSLLMLGRLEEAVAALAEATRLDPEDAAAWFNRGQGLAALQRWEPARQCLRRAEAMGHPQARAALNNLA